MRTGTTLDAIRDGRPVLAFRRFAAARADRMIEARSGMYCEVLDSTGVACGEPAYAEGETPSGDTVAACPMHDGDLT